MTAWKTVRTLTAAAADAGGIPAASTGVNLYEASPFVEFRLRDLVLAGAPTSITFTFWRVDDGVVEQIGTRTILAAAVAIQKPARFVCETTKVYATIAFTGGVAPTVTGLVEARGLSGVAESDYDNPDAVEVTASALPAGAATAANQATQITAEGEINAHVHSIDGKITACNTGAVTVAASALPSGASTAALQTTGNASLTSIDGKVPAKGTATMAGATPMTIATDDTVMLTTQKTKIHDGTNTAGVAAASTAVASTDPALAVGISPNSLNVGATYHTTAPTRTNNVPSPIESAITGALHISADLYDQLHQTHLQAAGAAYVRTPLVKACDGVRVDFDGAVLYYQPRGRPWQCVDGLTFVDPTKWSGANWTVAAAGATHTAGAVTALTGTIHADRPLIVGKRYAVVMKVSGRTAGSVTPYLGTQAGTARSTNDTFIEVITVAGSSGISAVPTNDFDGKVEILMPYGRSPKLCAYTYEPFAAVEIVGVAAASALGTLLAASDTVEVHACYRRVPGAADLG